MITSRKGVERRCEPGRAAAASMILLQRVPDRSEGAFRPFPDAAIGQSIPRRFEQQVRTFGERLAIRWPGGNFTYHSLNETANRLARTLVAARGISSEPVALLFDHGGDVLAAILAVLKSGKFYVILDPAHPPERLKAILDDSGARVVVAGTNHVDEARRLCADAIALIGFDAVDRSVPAADLDVDPAPGDLAMLLYTSGSTGRPKGVMHSHRNVLADARNLTNAWCVSARDRWLLYAPIGFANSVRTIYTALLNGASLYPIDMRNHGFRELTAWLLDNEISVIRAVPSFFRTFMASVDGSRRFPAVRVLSVGGEPMLQADLAYFNRHFPPHCVLSHAFGPTECLTVSWSLVPHGTPIAEGKLPIGHSLPDKDVRLLDESGRDVGEGEVGEIAVTSRYLSPGYWRDPERTRASFLPDPDGSDARTYLTGDLGMRNRDGLLVHVGRRDFQVKVRGYRIDVAEIENALRTLPGIEDAVVVGRELDPGVQSLVAHVVASPGRSVSGTRMRQHLGQVLPEYMIPSFFVPMDAIPLTSTGKTDRLRLPLPTRARRNVDVPYLAPRTAVEFGLEAIWAEALGLEQVGTGDPFLHIGGDSLKAMNILHRASELFGVELPISMMLGPATIAGMAEMIAVARSDGRQPEKTGEPRI